jgi:hypothetical protein
MKTKELFKRVRDKVVEKYRSGSGYKKMKIEHPMGTIKSILMEIGVSVHRTTLSRTLHRAGLYRRGARKKPLLKDKISKHVWCVKGM